MELLDLQQLADPSAYDYKLVNSLKGGKGTCEVYTKKIPSPPYSEEGAIIMMEVKGVYPSIGMHTHTDDEETYTVISGTFAINGEIVMVGESRTCKVGESHNAQLLSQYGALQFQKRIPSAE